MAEGVDSSREAVGRIDAGAIVNSEEKSADDKFNASIESLDLNSSSDLSDCGGPVYDLGDLSCLPPEIIQKVMVHLDARFLLTCLSCVCKTFYQLVNDKTTWRLRVAKLSDKNYPIFQGAHPIRLLPAVGGRLLRFAEFWEMLDPDSWVLQTISEGYKIEFSATPPVTGLMKAAPVPQDPAQRLAVEKEMDDLSKRAIRKASPGEFPNLYRSSFILTPKKPDTWRPILNLKRLNKQFICPCRFRMETLAAIIPSLRGNLWATSFDLKDAYLHIPIHLGDQRFLAFKHKGIDYVFQAMPFGLSTAPHVFTRITRSVTAFLRWRGIMVFAYLDDWLIVSCSPQESVRDTKFTTALLRLLGWVINEEKSSLFPAQHLTYLGANLNLQEGRIFPSEERLSTIIDLAEAILHG
ncbi:hypothetical protein HOLleu_13957 [Holothuria leucospilota]|uniref:F-box domain-containing protein n=1 Tax=Holothuria leucospilota TaxID=206669 RepID=A0A9Q1C7K2_HOLLE|nr:hypothetical protein HOLleu_13957 [Holothuria leucospilota]